VEKLRDLGTGNNTKISILLVRTFVYFIIFYLSTIYTPPVSEVLKLYQVMSQKCNNYCRYFNNKLFVLLCILNLALNIELYTN